MEKDPMKNNFALTKNGQPIKHVSYQDILLLQDKIDKLVAWNTTLDVLTNFFSDKKTPIGKSTIIKQYSACSKLFATFRQDQAEILREIVAQVNDLKGREKVRK